jgi:hypothetical protein
MEMKPMNEIDQTPTTPQAEGAKNLPSAAPAPGGRAMTGKTKGGGEPSPMLPPVDELERQLRSALNMLPMRDGGKMSDYPALLDGNIHHLLVCRPRTFTPDILEYQRRYEIASVAATKKEIAAFKEAAEGLIRAMRQLHAPARAVLQLDPTPEHLARLNRSGQIPPMDLETRLKILIVHAEHCELPDLDANAGKGRKKVSDVANFALEAAKIYTFMTGRRPTLINDGGQTYGVFLDFLTKLFAIFKVNSSPLFHARAAIKAMKEIVVK